MNKVLQNYYTKSANLKEYMVSMLNLSKDDHVLEPCGGTGEFIDSILSINPLQKIDTIDINGKDVQTLKDKYSHQKNVKIRKGDTLLDETFNLDSNIGGIYDKVIGNPPYGAWLDYNYRKQLKNLYKNLYVKESYLLFLIRSIFLLKNQGRLVFIIPDTFLYLHSYRDIRTFILKHTRLKEVITFPSSFFGSVDFQYSKLCIITLEKEQDVNRAKNNVFKVITGFNSASQIGKDLILKNTNTVFYKQITLLNTKDRAIMHNKLVYSLNKKADYTLGDIADCVTGIYTGNNKNIFAY
ncbi:N-6 DNA methylase (plasmid) [Xanthomonas oryzae pv. oryzae]|nr:N-6 DNA methylase [Xanthomonas oryzae pv. oryzae]